MLVGTFVSGRGCVISESNNSVLQRSSVLWSRSRTSGYECHTPSEKLGYAQGLSHDDIILGGAGSLLKAKTQAKEHPERQRRLSTRICGTNMRIREVFSNEVDSRRCSAKASQGMAMDE